ncbi:MAG: glycosyltransferase family 39 protein [Patescibacteria group bacterium]|nr:glycosyltransferase family 39 protein [Patescibacteria group bacterium]MDE2589826.1 glycosyltransferase family 39 protein [Patescibacteria group bacterium]
MSRLKKWKSLLLLSILILGAFLRLYRIEDYITFLGDEGRDVLVVWNILHGHLTLLGPTSSVGGFFLGPIYYYFMTPFLWLFNYNPVGPAVMIALFGIITIWLVYKIGSEFFDVRAGFISAFLYTISPLVIAYSRSSWNPNAMPIFTLLTLYVLYQAVVKKSMKRFVLVGFLFGIDMQLHYIETFVIPVIAFYILFAEVYEIHSNHSKSVVAIVQIVKKYLATLFGFVIGFSPFFAFEARHGFENSKNIITFIFHSKDTGAGRNAFITIGDVFFRVFGRLVAAFPPPEQFKLYTQISLFVWMLFVWILGIGAVSLLAWKLWRKRKDKTTFLQLSLLALWFGFGVILFGFYKKSIYDYYFEFMYPLPFLLVGNLFSTFWIKKIRWKGVVILSLGFLTVINLLGVPFRYEPNRQLNQARVIAKAVLDQTGGKPFNFALITGGNSDHAYRYFFTVWGHPPVTIENTVNDPERKTVTDQLMVVCESLPCSPLGVSLWEIAGFGRADIAGHWKVSVVEIYKLVHYKGS